MQTTVKRYIRDEVRAMRREIGVECRGDRAAENARAMQWIHDNAARFRLEWFRAHGGETSKQWGKPCSGAN